MQFTGPDKRGQHFKMNACLDATFKVHEDLPKELKVGLFAQPKSYKAIIRASNGGETDDRNPDAHGFAIKVLGVKGDQALKELAGSNEQDFILADSPVFFIRNASDYALFVQDVAVSRPKGKPPEKFFAHLKKTHPEDLPLFQKLKKQITDDPLSSTYWSQLPYSFGGSSRTICRYRVSPAAPGGGSAGASSVGDSENYLRERMVDRLGKEEVVFEFAVQVKKGATKDVVESPTVEWDEPYVTVASLHIAPQAFDTVERNQFGEDLTYTPWHALAQHKPLGEINAIRQVVYLASQKLRADTKAANGGGGQPSGGGAPAPKEKEYPAVAKPHAKITYEHDASNDGLMNRIESYVLANFAWLWSFIMAVPPLYKWVNKRVISRAVERTKTRPQRLSSMPKWADSKEQIAGYTSWESLRDKNWFSRHLPPRDLTSLPDESRLAELYRVKSDGPMLSEDSTALFLSFAQWFTDGFLMTDEKDTRRTHTSHHIDFNPLYGLSPEETRAIRVMSEKKGEKGLLKSETDPSGEVYAPRYFDDKGNVKKEFLPLRKPLRLDEFLKKVGPKRATEIKKTIFAFAGERANTTPYTAMLNTAFLREHNRMAAMFEKNNPSWDDERIFQTARNVNVVLLIKLVVEEYINHISPYHFQFLADPSVCWHADWNKPNWIPIEFNLLYRWHSLTPDYFHVDGADVPGLGFIYDNSHLTNIGLGRAMETASAEQAWNVGLMNTADFLIDAEVASVKQGRKNHIGSYNDYREAFGFPRVTSFEQVTGDPDRVAKLRDLYGHVDNLEFFVGLFAEDVPTGSAVPPLIGRMVALDAFSQALTNPLLSEHVYNEKTFSYAGMKVIEDTKRLQDVLNRNNAAGKGPYKITMTYGK